VVTVLLLLLLGVLLGHLRVLPERTADVLDTLLIRVALPGLILAVVPGIEVDAELLVPVVAAWGTLLLLAGLVWAISRVARLDAATTGTLLLVVPLANTSFLGYPAVEALLGVDHLPAAVVYDQLGTFLALATYGAVVAARYGRASSPGPRDIATRVVTFPPFMAVVLGFALVPVGLPGPVDAVASQLGATVTPLAMLAVGLRLHLGPGEWRPGLLAGALTLRLLLAPAVVLAVAAAVGGQGTVWSASVLEAAMPPMVTASVLASQAGLDGRLGARLVGVGVLVSMATLPAWAWVLG
jgi:malate permease and related proteins